MSDAAFDLLEAGSTKNGSLIFAFVFADYIRRDPLWWQSLSPPNAIKCQEFPPTLWNSVYNLPIAILQCCFNWFLTQGRPHTCFQWRWCSSHVLWSGCVCVWPPPVCTKFSDKRIKQSSISISCTHTHHSHSVIENVARSMDTMQTNPEFPERDIGVLGSDVSHFSYPLSSSLLRFVGQVWKQLNLAPRERLFSQIESLVFPVLYPRIWIPFLWWCTSINDSGVVYSTLIAISVHCSEHQWEDSIFKPVHFPLNWIQFVREEGPRASLLLPPSLPLL